MRKKHGKTSVTVFIHKYTLVKDERIIHTIVGREVVGYDIKMGLEKLMVENLD
jgi:hypothetical protein